MDGQHTSEREVERPWTLRTTGERKFWIRAPRLEFPILQFIANTKTPSVFSHTDIYNQDLSLFQAKKRIVLHKEASDPSSAPYWVVMVTF